MVAQFGVSFLFSFCLVFAALFLSSVSSASSSQSPPPLRRVLQEEKEDTTTTSDATDDDNGTMTEKHKLACKYALLDQLPENEEKRVGKAYEASQSVTNYSVDDEAGPTAAVCTDGFAGGYPCKNVNLLSVLDVKELEAGNLAPITENKANDIWGWTDTSSGREFAMIGLSSGTVFVEITDPYNPIIVGNLPTMGDPNLGGGTWRDMKTYKNYAMVVSEVGGHGMQIFDLTELLTAEPNTVFSNTAYFDGFGSAHNVFVNEDTGFAYSIGSNQCSGGLYVVDVNDALNPTYAGCFDDDGYTHDVQCVIYKGPDLDYVDKEICFASNEDTVTIIDVSDKDNMVELSRETYDGDVYTHQGWLTEDHSYFIFNDELDEKFFSTNTQTRVMDVRTLTNQVYAGTHFGRTPAIDHNLFVQGDYVYQANYRAGLNVLKIVDIESATFSEEGYFDIYPLDDSSNFGGAWGNYPYFPSGSIVVSGSQQGLFVVELVTSSCLDSLVPLFFEGSSYDCEFIGNNGGCETTIGKSHCPSTCGTCEEYGCSDSLAKFVGPKGGTRDCSFLASLPTETVEDSCTDELASTTCRETCGLCTV